MRNLKYLFRNSIVFLTFLLLQIFSLSIFFKSQTYQQVTFMNSTSGLSNTVVGWQHAYKRYFNLERENKKLQKNYQDLLQKSPQSFIKVNATEVRIDDTLYKQEYEYIAGDVLRSSTHKADNYITVNIGKKQGVKRGMGVINHDGLVGYVYEVSTHYCLIKSLLSQNINIDIALNSGQFGFLKWYGKNPKYIQVSGIPNDTELKKGNTLRTRGTGGIFPRGIKVGTVHAFNFTEGDSNWEIQLKPSVDFRSIKSVYVVKHLNKQELDELERRIE
jgi:rod shape-determining protein MreC